MAYIVRPIQRSRNTQCGGRVAYASFKPTEDKKPNAWGYKIFTIKATADIPDIAFPLRPAILGEYPPLFIKSVDYNKDSCTVVERIYVDIWSTENVCRLLKVRYIAPEGVVREYINTAVITELATALKLKFNRVAEPAKVMFYEAIQKIDPICGDSLVELMEQNPFSQILSDDTVLTNLTQTVQQIDALVSSHPSMNTQEWRRDVIDMFLHNTTTIETMPDWDKISHTHAIVPVLRQYIDNVAPTNIINTSPGVPIDMGQKVTLLDANLNINPQIFQPVYMLIADHDLTEFRFSATLKARQEHVSELTIDYLTSRYNTLTKSGDYPHTDVYDDYCIDELMDSIVECYLHHIGCVGKGVDYDVIITVQRSFQDDILISFTKPGEPMQKGINVYFDMYTFPLALLSYASAHERDVI